MEEIEREELEKPNGIIEQDKPKVTSKEIHDFIKSRDNLSHTDRKMLEKVVELKNQFPDESLSEIFESRYLIGRKSEKGVENQRKIIRFFKVFVNERHGEGNLNTINEKNNLDELNELISSSLKIIRENPLGIDEKTLMKKLKTNEENLQRVLPRILRLKNINKEVKLVNGIYKNIIKEVESANITELSPIKESKQEIKNDVRKTENKNKELEKQTLVRTEKIEQKHSPEMENITIKMIQKHLLWKRNINKELKRKVITEFVELGSLIKVYEKHPNDTSERIRAHIITDSRLPMELKKIGK